MTKNELLAVLKAYREAINIALPALHNEMGERSQRWSKSAETELEHELELYFLRASAPSCAVRLFFKTGSDLVYGGCNAQFAEDAGLSSPSAIIGLNDFDPSISWVAQAAKYRNNDREVMEQRKPMLGIIERQESSSGVIWLDTSKVPILDGSKAIGIFGTYEVIDAKTAWRRNIDRQR